MLRRSCDPLTNAAKNEFIDLIFAFPDLVYLLTFILVVLVMILEGLLVDIFKNYHDSLIEELASSRRAHYRMAKGDELGLKFML